MNGKNGNSCEGFLGLMLTFVPEFSDTKNRMLDGVGSFIEWRFHKQDVNEATAITFFFFNRLYIQSETEIIFF